MSNHHISDEQLDVMACEVVKILNGAPLGQALYVLKQAEAIMNDSHVIDTTSDRFKTINDGLERLLVLSDQSA